LKDRGIHEKEVPVPNGSSNFSEYIVSNFFFILHKLNINHAKASVHDKEDIDRNDFDALND